MKIIESCNFPKTMPLVAEEIEVIKMLYDLPFKNRKIEEIAGDTIAIPLVPDPLVVRPVNIHWKEIPKWIVNSLEFRGLLTKVTSRDSAYSIILSIKWYPVDDELKNYPQLLELRTQLVLGILENKPVGKLEINI